MKISCINCGANVHFDPHSEKFYCEYCNKYLNIEDFSLNNIEYDYSNCSSCGARLVVGQNEIATTCAYCGSNQILVKKLEENSFNPDVVLPFKIERKEVELYYRKFIEKHKKHFENIALYVDFSKDLKGIYVPYRISSWKLEMYANGKKEDFKYEDIEIIEKDLGKKFDAEIMESLRSFDIEKAEKFDFAYLAGYYAEIPDDIASITNREVLYRMYNKKSYQKSIHKINKMVQSNKKISFKDIILDLKIIDVKQALLPVWFISLNKNCKFAINGRTGNMSCILVNDSYKKKLIFDNENKNYLRNKDIKYKKTRIEIVINVTIVLLCLVLLAAVLIGFFRPF